MTRNKETVSLAAPIGNKSPFYKACSGWECQNLKLTLNLHFLSPLLKIIRCCNGGLRAKLFLGSLKHEIKKGHCCDLIYQKDSPERHFWFWSTMLWTVISCQQTCDEPSCPYWECRIWLDEQGVAVFLWDISAFTVDRSWYSFFILAHLWNSVPTRTNNSWQEWRCSSHLKILLVTRKC